MHFTFVRQQTVMAEIGELGSGLKFLVEGRGLQKWWVSEARLRAFVCIVDERSEINAQRCVEGWVLDCRKKAELREMEQLL